MILYTTINQKVANQNNITIYMTLERSWYDECGSQGTDIRLPRWYFIFVERYGWQVRINLDIYYGYIYRKICIAQLLLLVKLLYYFITTLLWARLVLDYLTKGEVVKTWWPRCQFTEWIVSAYFSDSRIPLGMLLEVPTGYLDMLCTTTSSKLHVISLLG